MATYELGNSIKVSVGETLIGGQTDCTLTMETETSETSTKDSGNWSEEEAVGLSWSISCDGLVAVSDAGIEALETAWETMEAVTMKYGTATSYKTGQAIIESLEQNSPQKERTTYSVSLKGVGALTKSTT
jgi:TP901-1 family phage major tail protein